ncbi:MAG: ABC transporter permease [archaeon]|nr:ABC transporter permease [archaeon]
MIKLSFLNLFRRKTRTFLAVAGIAIGVAAIIVLVSLVDGFTLEFDDVIGQFKAITIMEKDAQDQTLSKLDASFVSKLESMPYVKTAVPEIMFLPETIDGKAAGMTSVSPPSVYGMDPDKFFSSGEVTFLGELDKGSLLRSSDSGWVVLGHGVVNEYKKFVGSTIKINDKRFRVKGTLKSDSDLLAGIIVMNLADAREVSGFEDDKLSSITLFLSDTSKDTYVGDLITLKYGEDLTVFTQADMSEMFGSIIGNLRLLAIAVALISGIVAGIGIANTILMSVLERFKEIGSLKAVGWTNSNVLRMILYEALFLGMIGGVFGIILGFVVAELISSLSGIGYYASPALILTSFLYAILLGVIAGVYPAYRASKLDPIEALRS